MIQYLTIEIEYRINNREQKDQQKGFYISAWLNFRFFWILYDFIKTNFLYRKNEKNE